MGNGSSAPEEEEEEEYYYEEEEEGHEEGREGEEEHHQQKQQHEEQPQAQPHQHQHRQHHHHHHVVDHHHVDHQREAVVDDSIGVVDDDDPFDGSDTLGYRVLGVQPHSPASAAGLVSFLDFLVGANGRLLLGSGEDLEEGQEYDDVDLPAFLMQHKDQQVEFCTLLYIKYITLSVCLYFMFICLFSLMDNTTKE